MDEAERHRLTVDERSLARELGVPVVPAAARQGRGVPLLIDMIHQVATGSFVCKPHRIQSEPPALKRAVSLLVEKLRSAFPGLPNARWVALRLLEGDVRIEEAVRTGGTGRPGEEPLVGRARRRRPRGRDEPCQHPERSAGGGGQSALGGGAQPPRLADGGPLHRCRPDLGPGC